MNMLKYMLLLGLLPGLIVGYGRKWLLSTQVVNTVEAHEIDKERALAAAVGIVRTYNK